MSGLAAAAFGNRFSGAPNYTTTGSTITTPTYDGSGQTCEPTYRYFPAGRNGFKYWLAHNPLPGGSNAFENPSLLVSNDQTTWAAPGGLTNPITAAPAAGNQADCHLFFDPFSSNIWMFYARTGQTPSSANGIFAKSSTDGVTWSAEVQILVDTTGTEQEWKIAQHPSGTGYISWTQNSVSLAFRYRTCATITGTWSARQACNLTIPGSPGLWHMDIYREASGRYLMPFVDNATPRKGWIATSWDGVNWECAPRPFLLHTDSGDFAGGVYRFSMQPAAVGNGYDVVLMAAPSTGALLIKNVPATEVP